MEAVPYSTLVIHDTSMLHPKERAFIYRYTAHLAGAVPNRMYPITITSYDSE
jgi:hypothetical protein